jgi:hypothetical protein
MGTRKTASLLYLKCNQFLKKLRDDYVPVGCEAMEHGMPDAIASRRTAHQYHCYQQQPE